MTVASSRLKYVPASDPLQPRTGEKTIALVTANFGGIDVAKRLPNRSGIDAFYYTDELSAMAASLEVTSTWTRVIVPIYPRHDFSARLRARYFKHQIHRLDDVRGYNWLAWAGQFTPVSRPVFP